VERTPPVAASSSAAVATQQNVFAPEVVVPQVVVPTLGVLQRVEQLRSKLAAREKTPPPPVAPVPPRTRKGIYEKIPSEDSSSDSDRGRHQAQTVPAVMGNRLPPPQAPARPRRAWEPIRSTRGGKERATGRVMTPQEAIQVAMDIIARRNGPNKVSMVRGTPMATPRGGGEPRG
jgi:hypothetical protein